MLGLYLVLIIKLKIRQLLVGCLELIEAKSLCRIDNQVEDQTASGRVVGTDRSYVSILYC